MAIEFEIPVRTISEANVHEHWAVRSKRRKSQRDIGRLIAGQWTDRLPPKPWVLTLTRLGGRRLDTGNLAVSLKAPQDGLCDAIGINDGDEAHDWRYRQTKRSKRDGGLGVGVRIETIGGAA